MPSAPREILAHRHDVVRSAIEAAGLDALIVTHLPNIFYLTGFAGSAGILVIMPAGARLLIDFRYETEAAALLAEGGWPGAEVIRVPASHDEAAVAAIGELAGGRVGCEATSLPVGRYRWFAANLPAAIELIPVDGLIERARAQKDAHEVATLRAAARLLSEVARDVLRIVQPGPSEHELAALIDYKMTSAGFARPAFDTIVAAGDHAALPHARPTGRRLQAGTLVLLDFGGVYDGYCVDLSRTVCLGPADAEMQRVFGAVAQAQRAALSAVRPGVSGTAIDGAARDVLADRGLGAAFGHGTGHGLGIEIHEAPRVAPPRSASAGGRDAGATDAWRETIATGMVFTVEPGAYVAGWGGVRLEDDVLVTTDGCEVLTDVPRELEVR